MAKPGSSGSNFSLIETIEKAILFIALFLLVTFEGQSQLKRDLFPLDREFKKGFFYASAGLTYTYPLTEHSDQISIADTTYSLQSSASGNLSFAMEAGWYHSFKEPVFFHYLEGGIAYRQFKGSADIDQRFQRGDSIGNRSYSDAYSIRQLTASLRAIRAVQLGKYSIFTFGPGLNFDYHLNDNRGELNGFFDSEAVNYKLQLHLQFGVGLRLTEQIILMPQLELPLFEGYPAGKWYPTHEFYQSELYPLLFQIKVFFLRKDPMNCNAPVFEGPQPSG